MSVEQRRMTLSTEPQESHWKRGFNTPESSHWKRHPFVGVERGHARPQVPIKDFLHQTERRLILRRLI